MSSKPSNLVNAASLEIVHSPLTAGCQAPLPLPVREERLGNAQKSGLSGEIEIH